jgi:hypothetical protein
MAKRQTLIDKAIARIDEKIATLNAARTELLTAAAQQPAKKKKPPTLAEAKAG